MFRILVKNWIDSNYDEINVYDPNHFSFQQMYYSSSFGIVHSVALRHTSTAI